MHSSVALFVSLVGLVAAVPQPKCGVNDPCCPQPDGVGPKPTPDTDVAFLNLNTFASAANSAAAPSGYVKSFTNLKGATQQVDYLGLYTLPSYTPSDCAAHCAKESKCKAFNLYFERDPTVNPATNCANPASFTNVKCTLWGSTISNKTATNLGQFRGPKDSHGQAFHVVIAGSNGYSKATPTGPQCPGFVGPTLLPAAINAPLDPTSKQDTYMGLKIFRDGPFDPSRCAAECKAQTAYNAQHPPANGAPSVCRFFNTYILLKDKVNTGSFCALYSQAWNATYATNFGQIRDGANYTVYSSLAYTLV